MNFLNELIETIFEDLKTELANEDTFNEDALLTKVKSAVREVKESRNYPFHYSDEMILKDIERYYSNIRELAMYDYSRLGAEGQESHSENGTSRVYVDRGKCFSGIIPLGR